MRHSMGYNDAMDVHTAISLKNYTTMKLGGNARFVVVAHTPDEVKEIYHNAGEQHLPIFILGGGSNVIARDDGYEGIVVLNRIKGFDIVAENDATVTFKIGAGEIWDDVVKRTVDLGLSGIEAMSAIPGTAGATPVQNVGAYGQDISGVLQSLEAYDSQTEQIITLSAEDCNFSYRHSMFRGDDWGRYCIISITIMLSRNTPTPPFYATLQSYLDEHGITIYTPQVIRDAIIAIRADKLPDPKITPNTGSFFKNAIIEEWKLQELLARFPDMPHFSMPNKHQFKIPTGWLIEQAGLKGKTFHGMHVHDKNALVLINESATSYADLAAARDKIIGDVRDLFQIQIEQEPLELH